MFPLGQVPVPCYYPELSPPPRSAVSIEAIRKFVEADLAAVDEVIRSHLHSEVVLVRQVAEYIINSGGKRLRPTLLLLSAGAFSYIGKHHYVLAAVVEFIHTATLLHDDVVDESNKRRGQDTANAMFGNAASVLVGDFLYSRSFQMMVSVHNMRVMQVLADATNTIAEGEVMQLLNCHNPDVDETAYLRVIRSKTAKLFESSARLGAILGRASSVNEESLARYGMHVGTAFQLIDDVLDYSGNDSEIGKNLGDDLAEGKPTLPLIRAMQIGSPEQVKRVRKAIESGGAEEFDAVLQIIRDTRALDYVHELARAEVEEAMRAVVDLPDSTHKEILLQLADFAVDRTF